MRVFFALFSLLALTFSFAFSAQTTSSKYVLSRGETLTLRSGSWSAYWVKISPVTAPLYVQTTLVSEHNFSADSTLSYQWQRSATAAFAAFENRTIGETHALDDAADIGTFYRLAVTAAFVDGTSASVTSNVVGPVVPLLFTASIAYTSGTQLSASTVPADALNGAKQWQSSSDGVTYAAIAGAAGPDYSWQDADAGKYLRIAVTGADFYFGQTVHSNSFAVLLPVIAGTPAAGQVLASSVAPTGAAAGLQWQRSRDGINYSELLNMTGTSYTVTSDDEGSFIRLRARNADNVDFFSNILTVTKPLVSVRIKGTPVANTQLKLASLVPSSASVSYTCYRGATRDTITEAVSASTGSFVPYSLTSADIGKYLQLQAAGVPPYVNTVRSNVIGPIATFTPVYVTSSPTPVNQGSVLTAYPTGDIPAGATVSFAWEGLKQNGTWDTLMAANTLNVYTVANEGYKSIRAVVTINGTTVYSDWIPLALPCPLHPPIPSLP